MRKIRDFYKQKRMMAIIITVVVSILIIFLITSIFGKNKVTAEYDKEGNPVYIAESDYNYIFTNTDKYIGKFVDLTGKVFSEPEKSGEYIAFQMYTDVENNENDIAIYYPDTISISSDDYVKITGYIYGTMTGTNAFGGKISSPMVIATKIEKSKYIDVVSPTIKSVEFTGKSIINTDVY